MRPNPINTDARGGNGVDPDPAQRGLTGLAPEDDKASDPVAISLLGTDAVVLEADALTDPIE